MNSFIKRLAISGRHFICLLLLVVASFARPGLADDAADAIDRVDKFLKSTTTMSAEFKQVLLDEQGRVASESAGTMSIKRPGRFLWHYTSPDELLVVGDGTQVWSYDVELENATVAAQGTTLSGNPAALLSGDSSASEAFEFRKAWSADAVEWIELAPKGEQQDFRSIRLGLAGDVLVGMELHDQLGQTTRIAFDRVMQNSPLKDELFVFHPPKGIDVITAGGLSP